MGTLLAAAASTLVFCAPGYPGASGDAQPLIDQFAQALERSASWPRGSITAVYESTEAGGLAALDKADAALTFVTYPFFIEHAAHLHLAPLARADVVGLGTAERWTLVGKNGAVSGPSSVSTYTLLSVAGYAPDFVRGLALGAWHLPASVKIEAATQVLSVLRRIASGEAVIALLDQTQSRALPSLPFAADLKSVTESPALPIAVVAVVQSRLAPARAHELQSALLKLHQTSSATDALSALRLQGFALPQMPAAASP